MVKQVGNWVLRSVLGHGSFGEVHMGTHTETGKKVAVKVCTKQTLAKGQGRALLQREIATMKALDHENVLRLYEVLETTKRFYLVIELATNGELFSLIKNNRGFDDVTARRYFRQLLEGVYYCHAQGVVHRDLKPQNLLLTANNTLKIADFGFSRFQDLDENGQVSKSMRLQTQCGTPNYAAPEIFLGQGYDGFKTDIWACGVILYVMLSGGTVPFKPASGNGLQGVIMAIVQGSYNVPSHFSQNATNIIQRILVTEPADRATMRELLRHPYVRNDEEAPANFEIPKIVVSEDQVRNSIVRTSDEEDETAQQQHATQARRTPSPLGRQQAPSPSILTGGRPPQPPRSVSPCSPVRDKRQRGATFTQHHGVNLGQLDVEPLGKPQKQHQDPVSLLQSSPRSPSALLGDAQGKKTSFNTLGGSAGGSPAMDLGGQPRAHSPTSPAVTSPVSLTGGGFSGLGSTTSSLASTQVKNKSRSQTVVVGAGESPHGDALVTGSPPEAGPGQAARTAHVFKRKHWHTPKCCFYCGKWIYGVGKQGFSCIHCECPVHVKCVNSSFQNSCCEQYKSRPQKGS